MSTILRFRDMNNYIFILYLTLLATTKFSYTQDISPTFSSTQSVAPSSSATQSPIQPPDPSPTNQPNTFDACSSAPCQNGATCTSFSGSFSCSCLPGFEGTQCEISGTVTADVEMQLIGFVDEGVYYTDYTPQLASPTSLQFQRLCSGIETQAKQIVYAKFGNLVIRVNCQSFIAGSIFARFTIEMSSKFADSLTSIQNEIVTRSSETGGWFNNTATKVQILPSSVKVTDFDECSHTGVGYCDASAKCINTDRSFQCTCDANYVLTNNVCIATRETEPNRTLYIAIGVVAGLLALLLTLMCCFLLAAARRRKRRREDEEKWSNSDSANFWDFTSPRGRVMALPNEPLMRARLKQQELQRDRQEWDYQQQQQQQQQQRYHR